MTKGKLRALESNLRTLPQTVKPLDAPSADYHRLYATRRWRKRRAEHLQAEPLCRLCLHVDGLYIQADTADHITPHRGDRVAFYTSPLASLCKRCHDSRKAMMEAQGDYSLPPAVTPKRRLLIV